MSHFDTNNKPDDSGKITVIGHLLIRDKDTKAIIVSQRDQQRNIKPTPTETD